MSHAANHVKFGVRMIHLMRSHRDFVQIKKLLHSKTSPPSHSNSPTPIFKSQIIPASFHSSSAKTKCQQKRTINCKNCPQNFQLQHPLFFASLSPQPHFNIGCLIQGLEHGLAQTLMAVYPLDPDC